MGGPRQLIVTADDFGIGPQTSAGILDLARQGRVTATALLVNSPHADNAVRAWRRSGRPVSLGWQVNLTLDRPLLPPTAVPTLLAADGRFWPLGTFLRKLWFRQLQANEIAAELAAQYKRYCELVGDEPTFINSRQHVHVFGGVATALAALLAGSRSLPYVRRCREPWTVWRHVGGRQTQRALLNWFGRRNAEPFDAAGFPGNDWLAGCGDENQAYQDDFFSRWLGETPGSVVELVCQPGFRDPTLIGRDHHLAGRPQELALLADPAFPAAVRGAGFVLTAPSRLAYSQPLRWARAA